MTSYDNAKTIPLDHIDAHINFLYITMNCQEFKDCWALSNLRPLSAKQNVKEQNSRSPEQISKIKEEINNFLNSLKNKDNNEPKYSRTTIKC